jgi:peptidoglycan/xylan/chitin deacetylase (PgdA/CDA1 family)
VALSILSRKRLVGRAWRWLPRSGHRRVILLYHSVGGSKWAVPEAAFKDQVAWLAAHSAVMPLEKLLVGGGAEPLQVAITFDDGYASLADKVAPLLAAHGMTASVYVNTGLMSASGRASSDSRHGQYPGETVMGWEDAEALARSGWEIGSHGVGHLDLVRIPPAEWDRELRESKATIESRLNRECKGFAYPWGRCNRRLEDAVRAAGYARAVSGLHGAVDADSDRFALPRIDIRAEYEPRDFEEIVRGHWDYLGLKHRLARGAAWRS